MLTRILFNIALVLLIAFAPWWTVVLGVIVLLAYRNAPEVVFAGIALDVLYGTDLPVISIPILFTLSFALLGIAAYYIKHQLLVYDSLDT